MTSVPTSLELPALLDAMNSAGIGCTALIDRGGKLERFYANEAIARIVGTDLEGLAKIPPMGIVPPHELARIQQLRAEGAAYGLSSYETVVQRVDGTTVPVEMGLGHAIIDGHRAVFTFLRDISDKAAIQAALRESEERFRRLAESCPDSITVTVEGRYVYANPVAMRILGFETREALAAFEPWTSVPEDQRAAVGAHAERLRAGERIAPVTIRRMLPDGREQIFEASLSFAHMGGKDAILSYARDVTERQRLQAELMKQDRLASVGMLAAGVAHEINNPLAALALQASRLRTNADRHGLNEEVRDALEQIDDAAMRMRTIIADLLVFARPAERPQTHVDVAQILKSTLALFRAGHHGMPTLHAEIESLPPVQGYASKLGQVFLNVLRNAAQAVEGRGGGEVNVHARCVGDVIEVEIADNGPGVPSDLIPSVAKPFFTTKANGTGLGLWISQELMQQHGGSLELTSREGEGTRVVVRLPIDASPRVSTAT